MKKKKEQAAHAAEKRRKEAEEKKKKEAAEAGQEEKNKKLIEKKKKVAAPTAQQNNEANRSKKLVQKVKFSTICSLILSSNSSLNILFLRIKYKQKKVLPLCLRMHHVMNIYLHLKQLKMQKILK